MKSEPLALQAERHILLIRRQRVMLDYDLASLYGIETRVLKQAVRRNRERFPEISCLYSTGRRLMRWYHNL